MSNVNKIHDTKSVKMELTNNSTRKQAGSNNLTLTVNSKDWRLNDQSVSMTIRDAKALQSFLNQNLS
mgnify:CR=1 FL=1|jgi:hypothetical protein